MCLNIDEFLLTDSQNGSTEQANAARASRLNILGKSIIISQVTVLHLKLNFKIKKIKMVN